MTKFQVEVVAPDGNAGDTLTVNARMSAAEHHLYNRAYLHELLAEHRRTARLVRQLGGEMEALYTLPRHTRLGAIEQAREFRR